MATQAPGFTIPGLIAAADLSTKQFNAMRITAADTVNTTNAAGMACVGILQDKPNAAGQPACVMLMGVSKAVAGAAVAAGAEVMAGADGRIITAATAGSNIIGIAKTAAGGANEIFEVILNTGAAIV